MERPALSRGLDESGPPYDRQGKIVLHISREHKKGLLVSGWLVQLTDHCPGRRLVKYASNVESCKERQQDCKESQLKKCWVGDGEEACTSGRGTKSGLEGFGRTEKHDATKLRDELRSTWVMALLMTRFTSTAMPGEIELDM